MKLAFGKMMLASALAFTGVTGTMAIVDVKTAEAAVVLDIDYLFSGSVSVGNFAQMRITGQPGSSVRVELQKYSGTSWTTVNYANIVIEPDATTDWSAYISSTGTYRTYAVQTNPSSTAWGYVFTGI